MQVVEAFVNVPVLKVTRVQLANDPLEGTSSASS